MLEAQTSPRSPTPARRLLLVDPGRDDRLALRDMLRDTGLALEVTVSPSVGTARAMLDCNDYDCVLVCLSLAPDEALAFIKEASSQTAVVALSGGDMTLTGNAMRAGAQDVVLKAQADADGLRRSIDESIAKRIQAAAGFGRDTQTQQVAAPARTPTSPDMREPVTQVRNRDGLDLRMAELVMETRGGAEFCLVLVAIDQLVEFEFVHGPAARDELLREAARLLTKAGADTVGRFDDTRFGLLLSGTDILEGMLFAERLRQRLASSLSGTCEGVTASLGVASFDLTGTLETLVGQAEQGRRTAQRRGGGVGVAAQAEAA